MIFLIRCGENTKHEANPDLNVISILLKENFYQAIKYSEIVDTVEYIILENDNENALIGKIDKIEFCNGKIFILDRSVTRSIYVFDINGNFLNKINSIGRGPGEFEKPVDITINTKSNELLVYCNSLKKINIYNFEGDFIRDIKISITFRSFKFIYPDKIAVFTHNIYNYLNDHGVLPYNLLIFNLNNNELIAKQFTTDVKLNEGITVYSFNNYFAQNGDTILINWLFNDTIYQLDNLIAKPRYLINFGAHTIHQNNFKNDTEIFKDLFYGAGGLWSIYSSLIITEDYLLFRIIAGKLTEDLENTAKF